jgi:hypothetical protein
MDWSESRILNSVPAIVSVSLVNILWSPLSMDAGKICVNLHVLGGFRYDTWQVPVIVFVVKIVVSESLKRVLGGFLELVSTVFEANKKI